MMVGSDANLNIVLTAKDLTGPAFNKVQGYATSLTKSIFSLNGAITTLAGISGMGYMINQSLAVTAEMKKNADMAGISAKAYQELSFAAGKYQVTQNALTDGMKELALRADEFVVTGAGPSKEAFERLGYSQGELNKKMKDTPALLLDIIDRMQGLEQAAKIRIADELFGGTGGEQFISMINAGSGSIEELTKKANELGLVMSDKTAAGALDAHIAIETLTKQLQTQFNTMIAELAPDLGELAEKMGEWVGQNKTFLTQDVPGHVKDITGKLLDIKNIYDALPPEITGPVGMGILGTALLGKVPGKVITAVAFLNEMMGKTGNSLQDLVDKHYAAGEAIIDLWDSIFDGPGSAKPPKIIASGKIEYPEEPVQIPGVVVTESEFDPSIAAETRAQFWRESHEKLMADMKRMNADIVDAHLAEAIEPVMTAESIAAETRAQFWRESHEQMYADTKKMSEYSEDEVAKALESIEDNGKKAASEMERAFEGWANNFSSSLNDMVWGAEMSFGSILESFGKMITQMIIQHQVVEPMFNAMKGSDFGSAIGGFLGNMFSGGGGAASTPTANIGYTPSFAQGGAFGSISGYSNQIVSSPTAFDFSGLKAFSTGGGVMGEAGPEAVMPLTRMPGGNLGVKAQPGEVNVMIYNNTGAKTEVKETPNASGGKDIVVMIDEALGNLVDGNRGKLSQSLNRRGLRPQFVGR
jgi:hypothetical protein